MVNSNKGGDQSYPIYIGSGLFHKSNILQMFSSDSWSKSFYVTNITVATLYLDKVVEALTSGHSNVYVESVILPNGEQYKDMVVFFSVWFFFVFVDNFGNGLKIDCLFDW